MYKPSDYLQQKKDNIDTEKKQYIHKHVAWLVILIVVGILVTNYVIGNVFVLFDMLISFIILVIFTLISPYMHKVAQLSMDQRKLNAGIEAERTLYDYLAEIAAKYNLEFRNNVELDNKGKKFDVDFLLINRKRKKAVMIECKSFRNILIKENEVISIYPEREKVVKVQNQVRNTLQHLKRKLFKGYYIYPVMAFPRCIKASGSCPDMFVLLPDNKEEFEDFLRKNVL